ncbi:MAG: S-layer homology domain-containing protein [Actinobacteria bacterium]|nr:S-layer homology domain-containing protein [Actinomycetota bacterium]
MAPHRKGVRRSWGSARRTGLVGVILFILLMPLPAAADGGGDVEPTYSESNGCGVPRLFSTLARYQGFLSSTEPVRGPFGAMFGRTIGQARAAMVAWTVPFSGGATVLVHSRALPAFQQTAANLAANGGYYGTRSGELFGYAARTVSGTRSISYHAYGAAVDINSGTNPLASTLITDMPSWYVDAWRSAGFCWGGDWVADKKDAMHFSWMGPAATPAYGAVPAPYPSLAAKAGFTETIAVPSTALGARMTGATDALADFTGDGSLDAIRIRNHPNAGPTLEIMGSWADFGMCGFSRFQLTGAPLDQRPLIGNISFGGRPDLAFLNLSGSQAGLQVYEANGFYQTTRTYTTGASTDVGATYLLADYNSDGKGDLYKVAGADLEIWDAASNYATRLFSTALPPGTGQVLTADRDLDGLPDLYRVGSDGSVEVITAASGYGTVTETLAGALTMDTSDVVRVSDYDGDGHADLYRLNQAGSISVTLGNQSIYGDIDGWFRAPDFECESTIAYNFAGRFADDDQNPLVADIEWAAANGITVGCNAPFNDWFCPQSPVTRGQMATFLVRTLDLPAASQDYFVDDAENSHEDSINSIAAAGITTGCSTSNFCPEQSVTREQMASFLVRAFDLAPSSTNPFTDVGGVHAADIAALYQSGITTGCSTTPLSFCPTSAVLRDQMAAFLHRAAA